MGRTLARRAALQADSRRLRRTLVTDGRDGAERVLRLLRIGVLLRRVLGLLRRSG